MPSGSSKWPVTYQKLSFAASSFTRARPAKLVPPWQSMQRKARSPCSASTAEIGTPRANTIGFSVPINLAKEILPQLRDDGKCRRVKCTLLEGIGDQVERSYPVAARGLVA